MSNPHVEMCIEMDRKDWQYVKFDNMVELSRLDEGLGKIAIKGTHQLFPSNAFFHSPSFFYNLCFIS